MQEKKVVEIFSVDLCHCTGILPKHAVEFRKIAGLVAFGFSGQEAANYFRVAVTFEWLKNVIQ